MLKEIFKSVLLFKIYTAIFVSLFKGAVRYCQYKAK